MKIITQLVILLGVFAFSETSFGYSYIDNRGLMPMGESEEFMANTGIALSGSSGAVYYNPAGLASFKKAHISLSANSYLSVSSESEPFEFDNTDMKLTAKSFQAIPTEFVSTWKSGLWTLAFSILVPHQLKLQDSARYSSSSYSNLQLSRIESFQLLMSGFSAAAPFEGGYDLGAGCFYTDYQTTQQNALDGSPSGGSGLAGSLVIDGYFDAHVTGLTCNLGVQHQQTDNVRWGVEAHLPFVALNKSGSSTEFLQKPNTPTTPTSVGPQSVTTDYKIPLDIGAGVEYKVSAHFTGYADLNLQMPTSFSDGDINSEDIDYKLTPRLSVGSAYAFDNDFKLYAGLGYNPSAAKLSEQSLTENYVIGTMGVSKLAGNSNFGVGFLYAQSSGTCRTLISDAALSTEDTKDTSVKTEAIGVLVNSGFIF